MQGGGGGGIKLASIAITTPPAKTTYTAGETFDPAGMAVEATYSNGAKATATGYTFVPSTALTDGTTAVTIQYTEAGTTKTAEQAITVIHRLESVSVTTPPTKTTYEYGDGFAGAGMVVTATYSDGATENVTGYTTSPATFTTLGTQDVTATYEERGVIKTATTTVTVERKSLAAVPTQSGTLTYTGSAQSPTWSNYDSAQLTLGGVTSGTNAGSYNATFTPTANCRWSDGSTTAKTVAWSIGKAAGSLSISPESLDLGMSATSGTITATRAGDGAISATSSDTDVATVSVSGATIAVTANASGTATITVKCAEGTNHTAPANKTVNVTVSMANPSLADNTPETIKMVAQSGQAANIWSEGDKIPIVLKGSVGALSFDGLYYYSAFIIGFNHNSSVEGSNSIHFQFGKHASGTDIAFVDNSYNNSGSSAGFRMNTRNSNSGGWDGSYMRKTICPAFLAAMPAEWQNVIVACTKYSENTGGGNDTASYVTATQDKIWLLAEFEVFGTRYYANSAEQNYQKQYDYYKNGNSRIKYWHSNTGTACRWWLRSVLATSSYSFGLVNTGGSLSSYSAYFSIGFAPGFKVA